MDIDSLIEKDVNLLSAEESLILIEHYDTLAKKFTAYEQAVKVTLNAIYGAFGNKWFHFFNIDTAESITLQGQSAILYSENQLNFYFNKIWHKDTKVHEYFNIDVVCVKKPSVVYIDTDSVSGDSILKVSDGREIAIEQLYAEGIMSMGDTTSGHESVSANVKVLNWSENAGLYFATINRVIRHRVNKAKWKLNTTSGKEIIVTNDHSMIVFRDDKKTKVKPSDILKSDKVLTVISDNIKMNYGIEEIESIEEIGTFSDEYVYDIEVGDDTHTFITNDILVHNSCYVQFEEMYDSITWLGEKLSIDVFIMKLYQIRLDNFIKNAMDKYSAGLNTDNHLYFDLETISYCGIWLSKKKYIQDIAWIDKLDPSERYKSLSKIKTVGFDIIQSSTPAIARAQLKQAVEILLYEKPTASTIETLVVFLKKSKKEFKLSNIDDVCFNRRANNINKYIIDDTIEFQLALKCPGNVRGAGFYNFLLNNNPKYKSKYKLNTSGEKLKHYYCVNRTSDMFAYQSGEHPYEFAPPVDYEIQFEKAVIDPVNRILNALGLHELNRNLIYSTSLF